MLDLSVHGEGTARRCGFLSAAMAEKGRSMRSTLQCRAAVFQPPDALRPQQDQPFAVQVEVDQGEVRA